MSAESSQSQANQAILSGVSAYPERPGSLLRAALLRAGSLPEKIAVYGFDQVTSTMDVAAAWSAGELGSTALERFHLGGNGASAAFLAFQQSRGRGRKQRSWLSAEGRGLYVTYVFLTERPASELGGFSLAMGLAVQMAVGELGARTMLKWPNDVLAPTQSRGGQKKLAGILVEVSSLARRTDTRAIHVGLGLNVDGDDFPSDVPAVSLSSVLGKAVRMEEIFTGVSAAIVHHVERFVRDGFKDFAREWNERSGQCGSVVTVEGGDGVKKTGKVLGVADDGALRLEDSATGKIENVYSGEIV